MNRFTLNETSYHGSGAIQAIPEEIKRRGFRKIFVATDPDLLKFGVTSRSQTFWTRRRSPILFTVISSLILP